MKTCNKKDEQATMLFSQLAPGDVFRLANGHKLMIKASGSSNINSRYKTQGVYLHSGAWKIVENCCDVVKIEGTFVYEDSE